MPALRFDLSRDDPAAALAAAAAALERGELVIVPTETVYGIAAREDRPEGRRRLEQLKQGRNRPYSLALAAGDMLLARLAPWPPCARRLAARWWPGPVTLLLPDLSGALLGLRVPGHAFTRALVARAGAPLLLPSANLPDQPPPRGVDELSPALLAAAAVVVDGGRAALGEASTVVEARPLALRLVREGMVGRDELARHALPLVLLVCTGNTCRSPMAERLLRRALEQRAVAEPGLMPPRVLSAGLHAEPGGAASEHAVTALSELGLDLSDHGPRPLGAEQLQRADLVLCMSRSHAAGVAELLAGAPPEVTPRLELFDLDGQDVADPFGSDLLRYRAVARMLERLAQRQAERLLAPWRPDR